MHHPIISLLLLVLVIVVVVWIVLSTMKKGNKSTRSDGRNQALEIARERYAQGEITQEQFETIQRNLK